MTLIDHKAAAENAEQRALSCRARLQALQDKTPVTSVDAARAREALAVARTRMLAAYVRAGASNAAGGPAGVRWTGDNIALHVDEAPRPIVPLLAAGAISQSDLMLAYLALGGSCSAFEVDGYLHGALRLPRLEALVLDQAVVELTDESLQ